MNKVEEDDKEYFNVCVECKKPIPAGLKLMRICPTCLVKPYKRKSG